MDNNYLNQKRAAVQKAGQPARKAEFIDRPCQAYKPIAKHKHNVGGDCGNTDCFFLFCFLSQQLSYLVSDQQHSLNLCCFPQIEVEERKRAEGKKARDDKDKVMEMLYAAFEKHQYYNIKDLQKITRQPIVSWSFPW